MGLLNSFTRLHKWLAIVIGVQLLIWVVSGLVFSFIDHSNVRGNFIFKDQLKEQVVTASNFSKVISKFPNATQVSLISISGRTVFKVSLAESTFLQDIVTGEPIDVNRNLIEKVAEQSYRGQGNLVTANLISETSHENRGMHLPVWQLVYNDEYDTHLYLSSQTAEYEGVRTNHWRVFDFFMMLHFMDYFDRGNFNSGLIIFFALLMMTFSLSGVLLVTSSFSPQDFTQIVFRFFGNKKVPIKLLDDHGNTRNITVAKDSRLLEGLQNNGVELESVCGGGGICGACRIKVKTMDKDSLSDVSEHDTLTSQELSSGYRLACQLSVKKPMTLEVNVDLSIT